MSTPERLAYYKKLVDARDPDTDSIQDSPDRYLLVELRKINPGYFFTTHEKLSSLRNYVNTDHEHSNFDISAIIDLDERRKLEFEIVHDIKINP